MTEQQPTDEIVADALDKNDGSQPAAKPGDADWHGVSASPDVQKLGGAEEQDEWHGVSAEPKQAPVEGDEPAL